MMMSDDACDFFSCYSCRDKGDNAKEKPEEIDEAANKISLLQANVIKNILTHVVSMPYSSQNLASRNMA